jgi:hypothetical protein
MQNTPAGLIPGYCFCGALCEAPAITRCQKCRNRLRWYRRKAWRVKSERPGRSSRTLSRRK